jgi:hypothetical protein
MTYKHLQTVTLAANAAVINFSNIPQTGTDLVAKFSVRAVSGAFQEFRLAVNNNAASTVYTTQRVFTSLTGTTSPDAQAAADAATRYLIGRIPGATATANSFAMGQVTIPDYTRTTTKQILVESGYNETIAAADNTFEANLGLGHHAGVTNVTRLDFFVPGVQLVAGSTVSLYTRG